MSKYHAVFAIAATGALGLVVTADPNPEAENNTLRLPKDVTRINLADVQDVKFTPGVTNYEEARKAVLEVVRATVVETTPDEVSAASLQALPNILSDAQIFAIKAGWNEPSIFRTVYLRQGNTNVFTRFPNQIVGRAFGPSRNDAAVIAVVRGDANSDTSGLHALTQVIVLNAEPGADELIKSEISVALQRNNHLVVEGLQHAINVGRLDVNLAAPVAA